MRLLRMMFLVAAMSLVAAAAPGAGERHVNATLSESGGSGVTGRVELTAMPHGGTLITVVAKGLQPGTKYLSLYYDNKVCDLEPYSPDDVVGHYTADANGVGTVTHKVTDDLDEINSVSVRLDPSFTLQACATVHP